MTASQKTVAEKSFAKVAEPVSVAAKAGKFKIASPTTGADKSAAKVPKRAESESVARMRAHSRLHLHRVNSRGACAARPQGSHPGGAVHHGGGRRESTTSPAHQRARH